MNSKVFQLNKLLSELDGQGGYFIDFISTRGIQAGTVRLHAANMIRKYKGIMQHTCATVCYDVPHGHSRLRSQ
ncbi:MAG: hypothetical protein WAM42_14550 [Candidatus Nitrosopolaris sp.]|jgi:hypothetical protein